MTNKMVIALVALTVFLVLAVLPVSAQTNTATIIDQGDTVLVGESGLNITGAIDTYTKLAWWQPDSEVGTDEPEKIVSVTNADDFTISPATFEDRVGKWYRYDGDDAQGIAFYVEIPTITVRIWDLNQNKDVSGKSVSSGEKLTFRVDSNADLVATRKAFSGTTPSEEGFIDIILKTPSGGTLAKLYSASEDEGGIALALGDQFVNESIWYWGDAQADVAGSAPYGGTDNGLFWNTSAKTGGNSKLYPTGSYQVSAEFDLNSMQDNYENDGADYTGRTVSTTKTITLTSDTVKLVANKDSVTRSNSFALTITGKPSTEYYIWVKGTTNFGVTGESDDMPPTIVQDQDNIELDTKGNIVIGQYEPENKNGKTLYVQVPHDDTYDGTLFYAKVKTDSSGTRTIEWTTSHATKAQKYTFRVEIKIDDAYKSDETEVTVEKGAVTITSSGDGSYYLGEEIKFSGTNTETETVYLYISGPNLPAEGGSLTAGVEGECDADTDEIDPTNNPVDSADGCEYTFKQVNVDDDNTWSWKWGTATVPLDAGTYTMFAVSAPVDKEDLDSDTAYGTVSVIVKKPFVSATVSQSTVAKGDPIYVRGTAEGNPTQGVQIWILGKNYQTVSTETVNSDGSFEYEVDDSVTDSMTSGQYFVVVQHPMQNDAFDVLFAKNGASCVPAGDGDSEKITTGYVYEIINCDELFKLTGTSRLQGSDAAEALVDAINSADIDDTYTKLQFLVEEPVIQIDNVGDRKVGDKFTITAKTNLAVDDEILVEVYSSSFRPTQKSQSGEFSGTTGTVLVTKGETGMNVITFDIDASTFKPDEYIVTETGVLYGTTGTALFNVLEQVVATATPTSVPTTIETPMIVTTLPTPVPTATPTKTPTQPGFGAVVALMGLVVVGVMIIRRH